MTEIPEHLLKRSQAAKAKGTGEAAPAASPAPAAAAPARVEASVPAAAPAPATAAPPPPEPPYVQAAKARKKIPFWAMATLSLLPVWVFMYGRGLTPKEQTVAGPIGAGAAVYTAQCSSCHGVNGEGGVGYAFAGGEVLKTYPHIEDMLRWIYFGTQNYQTAGIEIPGNPERDGGPHVTGAQGVMPNFGATTGGSLTDAELLAVTCHVRYTLAGADPAGDYAEEFATWCSPDAPAWAGLEDGSITFANSAEMLPDTAQVGLEPAAGSAP